LAEAAETPAKGCTGSGSRPKVLGYASVNGDGDRFRRALRGQAVEIASECERRGLDLVRVVYERERQNQRPFDRPGLGYALKQITAGDAGGLVVTELSRVTHSVPELGRVLEWFKGRGARFVAGRPGLDTEDEAGGLAVRTIIEVSRWERRRLVERSQIGMRAARRNGPASVSDYPELRERIARMRANGMTLQAIADQLNAERVPTVRGGAAWRPSSMQRAVGYSRPADPAAAAANSA